MTSKIDPKKVRLYEAAKQIFGDWKPTSYQRRVFENVFVHDKTYIFEEWSRGAGKTVTALKLAFLAALLNPGRSILYIAPTKVDGDAIIEEKFAQEFPQQLMGKPSKSTGLFRFKNGSHISIIGSEGNAHQGKGNVGRGREPVLIIYDEFAYHNTKAHEALAPTLRKGGKLVIISTPPRIDDVDTGRASHYDKMVNLCKSESWASFNQVTCDKMVEEGVCTPEFLAIMEADYTSRGEHDEFMAEYWLKRVRKSADSYFREINNSILISNSNMSRLISSIEKPQWIIAGDSSGSTRWGTLLACLDQDKGILYLVDSIICKREGANDTENRIDSGLTPTLYWPKIQYKMNKWLPNENEASWHIIWDHETIFVDMIPQLFGFHISIEPVEKHKDKKAEIFSLIRDLINNNRLYISESCEELITEMKMLAINPKTGDFIKKVDELLDCLRYILMFYDHVFENKFIKDPLIKKNFIEEMVQKYEENKFRQDEDLETWFKGGLVQ